MKATVHVFLKNGVLDVQGKAVENALHGLGWPSVANARVGRVIEFELEARDAGGAEFGSAGVEAVLAASTGKAPADLVTRLRSAVRDHAESQRDDVTILVVRRT